MYNKFHLFNKSLVLASAMALSACGYGTIPELPENPNNPGGNNDMKPANKYFDFSTSHTVDLDINYGTWGANALIDIYDEFPEQMSEEGNPIIATEPIYRVFADANGRINKSVVLPEHAEHVYLYANGFGLPAISEADVKNGKLYFDSEDGNAATKTVATRAEKQYQIWTVDEANKLYAINPWEGNRYGKVTDVNGLISKGNVSRDQLLRLQNALWNGRSSRPSNHDNSKWAKDVDEKALATTLAKSGIENGEQVTYKDAEVWVTLVSEYAFSQISLGYYYYPTDQKPSADSFKDMKKFIAFPNVSMPGAVPYTAQKEGVVGNNMDYGIANVPVQPNTKCQLLYVDDEGNVSTHFPAGYTIGYFIISKLVTNTKINMLPDATYKIPSVMSEDRRCAESYMNSDNKFSCITLLADKETTFFCFENQKPGSRTDALTYDDVIFTVTTTPAMIDKQVEPKPLPEKPTGLKSEQFTTRTYSYEDLWPTAGDYDLNDVMVEHDRTIYFTSNNVVTKIVDTFIPCQPVGSATYHNAFAYYADYMKDAVVTLGEGVTKEEETGVYILFESANRSFGKSFTITTTPRMEGTLKKTDIEKMNADPFIIVKYVAGQVNRKEVHLPKQSGTSMADKSLAGTKDEAYYIDKNGNFPFAIDIPLPVVEKKKGQKVFIPVKEGNNIGSQYPKFKVWVSSNGTKNTDWYK